MTRRTVIEGVSRQGVAPSAARSRVLPWIVLCLLCASAGTWLVVALATPAPKTMRARDVGASAANEASHLRRLRLAPLPPSANAAPSPRSAFDFTGPESDGPSERHLSPAVSPDQYDAINRAWRSGDYEHAARLATALQQHGDRRLVLRPLVADWAARAPQAAGRFLYLLPAGVERSEMLEVLTQTWAATDLAAASDWINTLPSDPDVDRAVSVIATSQPLCQFEPEVALSWAESIETQSLRREAVSTVLLDWAARDRAAAERYLDGSAALNATERATVRDLLRQHLAPVR